MGNNENKLNILGVNLDKVTQAQALERFDQFMSTEGCSMIFTPNPEIVLACQKDESLKELIQSADMLIPDGIGLVHASRILKNPLTERVTGIDFSHAALEKLSKTGKRVYFLGGKPGIAEKAAEKLKEELPELQIAGARDGYFKADEEDSVVAEINNAGTDFLLVALGAPKQETFIYNHHNQLKCSAAVGIGGSLDVWSGTLSRAPEFYINHGIEWLYRLIQEPSRFKRMTALPVFLVKVFFKRRKNGN